MKNNNPEQLHSKPKSRKNFEAVLFFQLVLLSEAAARCGSLKLAFARFPCFAYFKKLAGWREGNGGRLDGAGEEKESGFNKVKKWTKKVDLFSFDFIFIPIHKRYQFFLVPIVLLLRWSESDQDDRV